MSLLAYSVRRAIGAVIVLLIVVLLLQVAIGSIDPFPLR